MGYRLRVVCSSILSAAYLLLVGCSNSTTSQANDTTTNPEPAATEQSTTTLNEADKQAATETELEQLVTNWYTFERDTSKGVEQGMPIQFTTGELKQRHTETVDKNTQNKVTLRSFAPNELRIIDITIDSDGTTAEILFCGIGKGELIDNQTDLVIAKDDGDAWNNTAFARLEDGSWLLYEFESDEALGAENGGEQCEITG